MESKNVCVFGFSLNEYVFMLLAIRYIMGQVKPYRIANLDELLQTKPECSAFCINCALTFYELDLFFSTFFKVYEPEKKPDIFCLAWEGIPNENLEIILKNNAKYILFDLESEEEFYFCKKAYLEKKKFRARGTLDENRKTFSDRIDIYQKLSKNQKYAFNYMMLGKTQKELQIDFGFNSLNTAASHWHSVLNKFQVNSVFELRAKFR